MLNPETGQTGVGVHVGCSGCGEGVTEHVGVGVREGRGVDVGYGVLEGSGVGVSTTFFR